LTIRPLEPELVIPDDVFTKYDPDFDITKFLLDRSSILAQATWPDETSGTEFSTGMLLRKALTTPFHHSNPMDDVVQPPYGSIQNILTALQTEQSLVTLGTVQATALKLVPRHVTVQLRRGYGNPETLQPPDAFRTFITNALYYKFDFCLGYGALDRTGPGKPFPPKWEWFRGFAKQVRAASRRYCELFAEFGSKNTEYVGRSGVIVLEDEELDGKPNDWKKNPVGIKAPNGTIWAILRYTPRLDAIKAKVKVMQRFGFLKV
jgi:hypothetical protein